MSILGWRTGKAIPFAVHYRANGVSVPDLTVTVNVYRATGGGSWSQIVTGAAASAGTMPGEYTYSLAAGSATSAGIYVARFTTASTFCDYKTLFDRVVTLDSRLTLENGVETSFTWQQAMRLLQAALLGEVGGANTETVTFFDPTLTRQRIVVTLDTRRNRVSVLYDTEPVASGVANPPFELLNPLETLYKTTDSSAVTADGEVVAYWPGQEGNGAAIQVTDAARPHLDADGLNSARALLLDGGDFMVADVLAAIASRQEAWAFAVQLSVPSVGVTPGIQNVLSLGSANSALHYSEFYLPNTSNPRFTLQRAAGGTALNVVGHYLSPSGLHTYSAIMDGSTCDLGIDGAHFGPQSLAATADSIIDRVTLYARRRNSTASLMPQNLSYAGKVWVWQGGVTPAQIAETLRADTDYDTPVVDQVTTVGASSVWKGFPDLYKLGSTWVLCYRESPSTEHADPGGHLHIYTSADLTTWTLRQTLTPDDTATTSYQEMRFCPGPGGTLYGYTVLYDTVTANFTPLLFSSPDGITWSEETTDMPAGYWFWRPSLGPDGKYYCVAYNTESGTPRQRLFISDDGLTWTVHVATFYDTGAPTEAEIAWDSNDVAYCVSRLDGGQQHVFSTASAPYTSWTFSVLSPRMQSPKLVILPDDRMVCVARSIAQQTVVDWVDPLTGAQERVTSLPTGGTDAEGGYAGAVWDGTDLRFAYYANHTGAYRVYVGRLRLPANGGQF